jgi:hypothetical protein
MTVASGLDFFGLSKEWAIFEDESCFIEEGFP